MLALNLRFRAVKDSNLKLGGVVSGWDRGFYIRKLFDHVIGEAERVGIDFGK